MGDPASQDSYLAHTQNKHKQTPCLEWDSNKLSQYSSGRKHFTPQTALDVGECSASRSDRFITWERAPGTHYLRVVISHNAGQNAVEMRISCPCRESYPSHKACFPSLYRLSYTSSPRLKKHYDNYFDISSFPLLSFV
jgi:hypothetical protein